MPRINELTPVVQGHVAAKRHGDREGAQHRVGAPETIVASLVYLMLALAVFWPVVVRANTWIIGLGGDGDNLLTVWQLWWFRHAILTGQDPAFTHNVFALYDQPVPFFVENFFTEAVAFVLQPSLSPLAAYNVLVISSFVLGGITAYCLASEFVENRLARFAAGFIFVYSTFHLFRAAGHLGEVTMEWLPFFAWRMVVFTRRPTVSNAFFLSIGLALVPLSEVYYGAYFAFPVTLIMLAYLALTDRSWFRVQTAVRFLAAYALAGALAVLPLHSFLHLDASTKAVTAAYASSSIVPLSADLAAFFLPNEYNPIFGPLTKNAYTAMASSFPIEQAVYLGLIACSLAILTTVLAARRSMARITWLWLSMSIAGVLLALGPTMHFAGRALIYLPFYKALFGAPVLSNFRAPNRLVVLPLLGVAMLAGMGVDWIMAQMHQRTGKYFPGRVVAVGVMCVSFSETFLFSFPYPASAVTIPAVYSRIGSDRSDSILLDLPVLPSGYYQMLQIFHGKRLVNGYTSRVTPEMMSTVTGIPSVSEFVPSFETGINLAGPRDFDRVPATLFREQLRTRNIHYVVFHKIVDKDSLNWAEAFLRKNLGPPMDDERTITVWRF